jgi:cytidine deaminase
MASVAVRDPAPGTWQLLRERSLGAMDRAYAPYSSFRVGAALLAADGSIVEGCNVENAAYPAGMCAERVAVGAAVARGLRDFQALALATEAETPTPPCGICRQVLMEFAPNLSVLSVTRKGAEARWTMSELLPDAFTPTSLGRR